MRNDQVLNTLKVAWIGSVLFLLLGAFVGFVRPMISPDEIEPLQAPTALELRVEKLEGTVAGLQENARLTSGIPCLCPRVAWPLPQPQLVGEMPGFEEDAK